jgi:hypothetical protein
MHILQLKKNMYVLNIIVQNLFFFKKRKKKHKNPKCP